MSSRSRKYIKCVIVGDGGIGKTSLVSVYTSGKFPVGYIPTIMDSYAAKVKVKGEDVTLDIWDTAGQEDFSSIRSLSYPNASVMVLCYSTTLRASFENIESVWLGEVLEYCPGVPFILCGTKADMVNDETPEYIPPEEAEDMCKKIKAYTSLQCSAKTMTNVQKVFQQCIICVMSPKAVAGMKKERGSSVGSLIAPIGSAVKAVNKTGCTCVLM
uniref:Uncharacterized protein n=2 Tax=Aplanochytrium stocchinoi TaxID=215587 RepID=A0A7S3PEH3_9STRA|mmetsp:Transcript_21564/g.27549  ORF Transcript_21564/g.27549 Transcript_21564/m.27549 type:complete len:214 (+) Transcript_21564:256-897(+)|eukprot:CAMPEP_0204867786 /NCGR_PEP_ID=MMETSP1348-20121228/24144_1 /ASSEMBLY_ACC=CAM_ASM_000700 /TAXON_ID=215587 /ORGANISM="Aplanochytrium stocchinoi, Strain GSBS06" /LENGTH=213 /DNA_ID=CAMNT_0052020387 /DNA_START=119 /DNA_END=760 /DNA_ORIENTATION=-